MRVEPDGNVPSDLAIFGEAPGYEEQMEGRGFVGKSGQELWAGLDRFCGLTRADFYVSNIVKDGLAKNRDPKPAEIAAAMPEFFDELERVRPRILITAGGFATRAALGPVLLSNVHGIPHGAWIGGRRYTCFPMYHPAAGLHNKGLIAAFAYDLKHLAAFRSGQIGLWAPSTRPACVEWLSEAPGALPKVFKGVVGLDTEGWAELPRMLSFSLDGETAYVIRADEADLLRRFFLWLKGKTIAMHHGIHDMPVLRAMGGHVKQFHDTQVLAFHDMLRTGSGVLEAESQNLGTLAYRECQLQLGELKDLPGVDLDAQVIPYSEAVKEYAGLDAIAVWRLFQVYKARGIPDLLPYQIDMGQVPLVEDMIATGIPVDVDATLDYYTEILTKLANTTAELRSMAKRLGNSDFNPGSHPQVRELLTRRIGLRIRKRTKGGKASTNEKALADHKGVPLVEKIQEHRELVKLKGTYLEPLMEELQ